MSPLFKKMSAISFAQFTTFIASSLMIGSIASAQENYGCNSIEQCAVMTNSAYEKYSENKKKIKKLVGIDINNFCYTTGVRPYRGGCGHRSGESDTNVYNSELATLTRAKNKLVPNLKSLASTTVSMLEELKFSRACSQEFLTLDKDSISKKHQALIENQNNTREVALENWTEANEAAMLKASHEVKAFEKSKAFKALIEASMLELCPGNIDEAITYYKSIVMEVE